MQPPSPSEDRELLRQAWTDLIRANPWTYFLTLTFGRPVSRAGALRAVRKWLRITRKRGPGAAFFVVERGGHGLWHAHLLILGTGELTRRRVEREWRRGWVEVDEYDTELGVAYYLSKFTYDDDAEYDFETWGVATTHRESHQASTQRRFT